MQQNSPRARPADRASTLGDWDLCVDNERTSTYDMLDILPTFSL